MATRTPKKARPRVEAGPAQAEAKTQEGPAPLFKAYDELSRLSQDNFEAVVAANQALARGAEEISKEIFGIAQCSFENAASAAKAFFGVKTLPDLIEFNTKVVQSTFDSFLVGSAKLSDAAFRAASEAAEPLKARVDATVEKLGRPAAV
jgi:phasin family protein